MSFNITMTKKIEALIKRYLKGLVRSETKTLVQYHNSNDDFICGYSEKPKQIHFYFQPLYDQPKQFNELKMTLRPYLKGKSCLHLPKEDQESLLLIEQLFKIHSSQKIMKS